MLWLRARAVQGVHAAWNIAIYARRLLKIAKAAACECRALLGNQDMALFCAAQ